MKNHQLTRKQAIIYLFLDDFYESLKGKGTAIFNKVKNTLAANKPLFESLISALLAAKAPALLPVADAAWTAIGGSISS